MERTASWSYTQSRIKSRRRNGIIMPSRHQRRRSDSCRRRVTPRCVVLLAMALMQHCTTTTVVLGYQPVGMPIRSIPLLSKPRRAAKRKSIHGQYHDALRRSYTHAGLTAFHLPTTSTAMATTASSILQPHVHVAGNVYMVLLALQFAVQPIVTRQYASKSLIKGTYVFWLDVVRAFICAATLLVTQSWTTATAGWRINDAALAAGVPSMLYVAQNYFALQAYQNLSPITFNVLNQTKTLSAALWCFVLLGHTLRMHQVGALGILLLAALVMENILPLPWRSKKQSTLSSPPSSSSSTSKEEEEEKKHTTINDTSTPPHDPLLSGVVPVLLASLLSGLAGALAQRALQTRQRNSLLFSLELATCSLLTSTVTLGILPTPDHRRLVKQGWWQGWTAWTWVPLVLQASGGVLVGLVTKYAGSVRKGFCLIQGMFLSGILQNALDREGSNRVRTEQWIGGILAALSFWMYTQ